MKFKVETTIDIDDFSILDLVNTYQDMNEVEQFDELNEVPLELIYLALEYYDEFEYQINDLSQDDFVITSVDEEN